MLLGIYDDLLLGGGAAALAGGYRILAHGYPLNPQNRPQIVLTRDLINWTVGVAPWVGFVSSVAQGNELMMATGNAPDVSHPNGVNRMALSKDYGKTWAEVAMPGNGLERPIVANALAFGRGLFVACAHELAYDVGVTGLSTSPDGITWTPRQNPWVGPAAPKFVNGLFVLYGYDAINVTPAFATSTDGVSWVRRPSVWGTMQNSITNVDFQNGNWILSRAGYDGGAYAYSPDLNNWTIGALPVSGSGVFADGQILAFKGRYYGFSGSFSGPPYIETGTISVSADLKTWRVLNTGLPPGPASAVNLGDRLVLNVETAPPLVGFSGAGLSYSSPGPVSAFYVTSDMQNFSPLSVPGSFYAATINGRIGD